MSANIYGGVSGVARKTKKAYLGIPTVTLTNMLPAINGTTGWETTAGTVTAVTSTKYTTSGLRFYGGSNAEAHACTTTEYTYQSGHKYYIRNEVYFSSDTVYPRTSCYWPIAEPNVYNSSSLGISIPKGQWYTLAVISDRVAAGHTAGSAPYRIDFDNNKGAGYMYLDGCMLIDLTAAFGSGKEPTLAWCNANIPYFTGAKEIIYSGVTSRARKILKGYIGVNGVARLCFDAAKASKTLVSIEITKLPDKTSYTIGEDTKYDWSGIEVTATYSDGTTAAVDSGELEYVIHSTSTAPEVAGEISISAMYREDGVTCTDDFTVTVVEAVVPVTVTLVFNGNTADYAEVSVGGTWYTADDESTYSLTVYPDDVIQFHVAGQNSSYPGEVVDNSENTDNILFTATSFNTAYSWTVPNGITTLSINLHRLKQTIMAGKKYYYYGSIILKYS